MDKKCFQVLMIIDFKLSIFKKSEGKKQFLKFKYIMYRYVYL